MARPTTKNDLIQVANESYENLIDLIHSIPKDDLSKSFDFDITNKKEAHWKRDKNIRDVLIHLYEWHNLLLNWVDNNQKGNPTPFLKEGYNWKSYGNMNIEFFNLHQTTDIEIALENLNRTHHQVIDLANTFSNDELFSKGVYKWVGGSTLGSYFTSATSSHYEWAIKKIRLHKNSRIKASS